ncbi:MAG: hypothetical protein SPL86_06875 [Succiniclasticum sp.]|uniref:hypothetical protein n=1 Tax=Succiniclasticum sp. TaxID=2775030 RepID=UPI002A916F57|nr:hypothetical protein [Succiniclasticum sp.]MDY6291190.1 hypothetical protein [Succiniclasticum sp.]
MDNKKLVMPVMVAVMTLAATSCFARVPMSDLNIGGFYYGQPWDEVVKKSSTMIPQYLNKDEYFLSDNGPYKPATWACYATRGKDGTVIGVSSVYENISTNKGIGLDVPAENVIAVYGQPDMIVQGTGTKRTLVYLTDTGTCVLVFDLIRNVLSPNSGLIVERIAFGPYKGNSNDNRSKPQAQQRPPMQQPKPKGTIPDLVTEMSITELNIGGIEPGQNIDYVEQVYGKPSKIDDEGFFQTYNYNDKFIVKGKMNNGYKVMSVASYEKGMKTPSGFMVGDSYSAVVKKFGAVKGIKFKGEGVEAKLKGCTDYTYFSGKKQMVFIVDKNDVIRAIRVEELDEQKFIEAKRKK